MKNYLINSALELFAVKKVRKSVTKYHGKVNFAFSQVQTDFLKEIIKHKQTSGGICNALTSYWIALHAQGKNLFKEIITGDENKLNKNKIFEIKKLQVDFDNHEESFLAHKNWLNSQGLDYKTFYKDDGYFKNKGTKNKYQRPENTTEAIKNLAESIVSTPGHNKNGEYKKISLHGSMLGYSVSAYINKNTVIYFDPNFGEFEFNKKNDFIEWFVDKYWSKSLYKNILNKKFFVDHFEKINTVEAGPSKKFSTNNVRKTHTDLIVHHNTLASATTTASDTHHAVKNTDVKNWEKPEVTTKTDGGSTDYDGHLIIQMENDAIVAKAAADLAGKHHDSVLVQLDSDGHYHLIHGDTTQLRDKMNLRVQVVAHSREGGAAVNNLTFAGQTHPELATTLNRFLDEFKHDYNVEIKPARVVLAGCSLAGPNKQNDFADGLIRGLDLETVSVTAYTDELAVADNGHRFIVDSESNLHGARQGKIIYHKDQQQGVRVEIKADEPTKLGWIMQLLNQLADETQTVPSLGLAERSLLSEAFHLSDGQLDIQRVLLTAHHPERRQTWYEDTRQRLQKLLTHREQASLGIQDMQLSLEQQQQVHQQQKQRALAFYEAIKNTQKAHPGITVDMKLMSPAYFLRQGIDMHKDSHAWSLAFLDAKQSGEKYDIFSSGLSADALRREKIIHGRASGSEIAYAHHLDNQFKELKNRPEIEVNNKAVFTPPVQDLFHVPPTPGAYLLKGDHHSIALSIKQNTSGSYTYSLYDPQVGNVDLTRTSSEGGDALYHLLDHYLQGKDKDGRTRAQQYGFEKMGNKYAFNAYQVNIEQARKQIPQLDKFQTSLNHQLATDRLSSNVTLFDDVTLPFKTLLDMGVTFEGRLVTVGQQINRIDADSLKTLSFRPQQLYDFLTKNNLDHPDVEPALRLIKKRMGAIDGNSSSLIARELIQDQKIAKKTLTLLDKVNQHTEFNPDGTVSIKNKLMRSLQPKNLMHRINKGANYAGPGMSVLGYYFGYRSIDSYNNALKQEGLTPEKRKALESERDFAVISIGLNAGVDIGQYGMSKMASVIIKNNAMKSVGQIGSKMRLIKVGGAGLSMVGVGLDVHSAYQSFSKLDTETDPDMRQDLIVSGSLSVAGAVVGIGATAAFIVGGSAAAAGPLGLVIGGVLLAGGQIYSAVRQVEEIEKQIYLSVGDKWETGWRAFWMLPPSKEIQDRLANSQRGEYREMCDIFLEKNAMKMLTGQALKPVYRYVYSLKDFDLKPEKYLKLFTSLPFVGLIEIKEGSFVNPGKVKKEDLEKSRNELKEKLEKQYGKDWESTYHRFEFIETNEYYYTPIFKEVDDVFDPAHPASTKNATSLDNLDNTEADGSVIFNLGDGNDKATGYRRRSNTFFGGKGAKKYTGRSFNDLFYLGNNTQDSSRGDFIGSVFDGQDGEDTLVIQATPKEVDGYLVRLVDGYIYYKGRGKSTRMEKMAQITDIEHIIGHATLNDTIMGNEHDNQLNGQGGESLLYGLGGNDTLTLEQGYAEGGEGEDSYIILQNETGKEVIINITDQGAREERSHVILKHGVKQIQSITLVKKGSPQAHYSLRIVLNNDNGTRTQVDLADSYRLSEDGAQLQLCSRYSLTTYDGVQLDTTSWPETIKVDDNNTETWSLPVLSAQYVASLDHTQKQDSNSAVIFAFSEKKSRFSLPVPDARVIKINRVIGDTSLHNRIYGNEDNNQLISQRGRSVLYGMAGNDMLVLSNGMADGGAGEDSTTVLQNTGDRKAEIDIIDTGSVTAENNHVVLQHDVTQIQSIVLIKKAQARVNPKWEKVDNYTLRILLTNDNGTTTQVDLEDTYRLSWDGTQLQSHNRYSLTTRDGIQIDMTSWPDTLKVADKHRDQNLDTWQLPLISGQYVPVYDLKRSAFLGSPAAENSVIEFIQKNPEGYSEINVGEQKTVLPKWLTLKLGDTGYHDKIEGDETDNVLSSALGNDVLKGGAGSDSYQIHHTPQIKKTITIDNEDKTARPDTDFIILKSVSMDQLNTLTVKDDDDLVLSAATPKMDVGILELRLRRFMKDKRYQHMVIIDKVGDSYLLEKGEDGKAHIYTAYFDKPSREFKKGKQQDNLEKQATSGNDVVRLSNAAVLTDNTFRSLEGHDSVIDESDLDLKVYAGTGNDNVLVGRDRTGKARKGDKTFYGEAGDGFLAGGADSDHLYGGIGNDTLQGNTGNDRLEGGEGDDTYLYTVGDGDDVIKEIGGNNVLVLLGVTEQDVQLERQNDHLYLFIAASEATEAGEIKIQGYFASEKHRLEKLQIGSKEYHMSELLKRGALFNPGNRQTLIDLLDQDGRSVSGLTQAMNAFHEPPVVNTVLGPQDMGLFGPAVFGYSSSKLSL